MLALRISYLSIPDLHHAPHASTREERCFLISLASPYRARASTPHITFYRLEGNMVRSVTCIIDEAWAQCHGVQTADCRFCSITPFILRTGLLKIQERQHHYSFPGPSLIMGFMFFHI